MSHIRQSAGHWLCQNVPQHYMPLVLSCQMTINNPVRLRCLEWAGKPLTALQLMSTHLTVPESGFVPSHSHMRQCQLHCICRQAVGNCSSHVAALVFTRHFPFYILAFCPCLKAPGERTPAGSPASASLTGHRHVVWHC